MLSKDKKKEEGNLVGREVKKEWRNESRNTSWITNYSDSFPWHFHENEKIDSVASAKNVLTEKKNANEATLVKGKAEHSLCWRVKIASEVIRVKDKVDFFVEICKIANKVMRVKDKVDFFEKTYVKISIHRLNIFPLFYIYRFHRKQERNGAWNQSVKDESTRVASRVLSGVACSLGSRESWFQRWKGTRGRRKKRKERGGTSIY